MLVQVACSTTDGHTAAGQFLRASAPARIRSAGGGNRQVTPDCDHDEHMERVRRSELPAEAQRLNREQCARMGREIRASRLRRKLTQAEAAARARISRSTWSRMENGKGAGQTVDAWQRAGLAVGRPLRLDFGRDPLEATTSDAGHLAGQELILRLIRATGPRRFVELPTRPADSRRAIDVAALDERHRVLLVVQVWNTFGDLGSAVRGFNRELAAAAEVTAGMGVPDARVAGCWALVDNRPNRSLLARYPEFFATRFPGSSFAWARAITTSSPPPQDAGIVWLDLRRGELVARRRR